MQTSNLHCQSSQKVCVEQLCLNDAKANAAEHEDMKATTTSVYHNYNL
jgi:hypothetical protein